MQQTYSVDILGSVIKTIAFRHNRLSNATNHSTETTPQVSPVRGRKSDAAPSHRNFLRRTTTVLPDHRKVAEIWAFLPPLDRGIPTMFEGDFNARTRANLEIALDRVCQQSPIGDQHELRKRIAQALIRRGKRAAPRSALYRRLASASSNE
jgi:hypothetical protein